jgi:hypothetical protein
MHRKSVQGPDSWILMLLVVSSNYILKLANYYIADKLIWFMDVCDKKSRRETCVAVMLYFSPGVAIDPNEHVAF